MLHRDIERVQGYKIWEMGREASKTYIRMHRIAGRMGNAETGKLLVIVGTIILVIPMLMLLLSFWISGLYYIWDSICTVSWLIGFILIMAGRALQATARQEKPQQGYVTYQAQPIPPVPQPAPQPGPGPKAEVKKTQPPRPAKKETASKPVSEKKETLPPPPKTGRLIKCPRCAVVPAEKDISPTGRIRCPSCGMVYFK